jgi:hypothetical protein
MNALQRLLVVGLVLLATGTRSGWATEEGILTSDPAAIRVALVVPGGYAIGAKGANMRFTLAPDMPAGAARSAFALVEQASTGVPGGIAPPAAGSTIRVYALAPGEVGAVADLLQQIRAYKTAHAGAAGMSLSIDADLCRNVDTPARPALFSLYFRSGTTADYEPLEQNIDLAAGEAAQRCGN